MFLNGRTLTPNPMKCEKRDLICYLFIVKNQKPVDDHSKVVAAYSNFMLREVANWCRNFTEGQTNVYNENMSGSYQ